MATVSEMIELRPLIDRKLPENFKYYGNWGFTIYRTYYSPESDEHWEMLLNALKRQTYLALGYLEDEDEYRYDVERRQWGYYYYENKEEYVEDLKRVKKLFHLDPREDPPLLDGLDARRLQEVCLSQHPEAEKTIAGGLFCFILAADKPVLKDITKGEFIIKTMRIPTGHLLEFWHSLIISGLNYHQVLYFKGPEEDLKEHI
ncbi:hypothetical protein EDB81DRAFT_835753 [Dactylonectria macrodidyma]|uniref:Uncharacterized protein n=1 Tax=Dactylonectria macrodidyma TaxID=307937 RepID=A0A9P9FTR6_9HYPO|nr:hypothetical protein EDB81DRAFT_835753 [Dactylonectria macrodidyma]